MARHYANHPIDKPKNKFEQQRTANKVLPKAGLNGFDWTYVQGSTFVLRLNFSAKTPPSAIPETLWASLKTALQTIMKRFKKILFNVLIGLTSLGIPVFAFGIINTMVSLKNETENSTDCISIVTGQDLCMTIKVLQGLIVLCIATIIGLIVFRKRFLQQ